MEKIHLLVIDPQFDFCDPAGALYVPGADLDIKRLVKFVRRLRDKLTDIHCTLDSHHLLDIAHPLWWKNSQGRHPDPFTIIEANAVENGEWTTTIPGLYCHSLDYVKQLSVNGRYPLCIWPPHCLIGGPGSNVVSGLFEVFAEWEEKRLGIVDYVTKGSNPWTEHYSAVQADVPDPRDPGTMINTAFVKTLEEADIIVLAGEAGSHCLANTVRDVAANFGSEDYIKKMVLLEDATSPVPGFEDLQEAFVKDLSARGMQIGTTDQFLN